MQKLATLREALVEALPHFKDSPDALVMYIDEGSIRGNLARGLSFAYAYKIKALATDYPAHPDSLIVPLLGWIKRHQPDLLQNPDRADDIKFAVEILSAKTYDIEITIPVTESVRVIDNAGQLEAHHLPEPVIDELADFTWDLYIKGVHVPWPPVDPLPLP